MPSNLNEGTHLHVQPPLLLPEDSHRANVQHFLSPTWRKFIWAVSLSTTSQEPDLSPNLLDLLGTTRRLRKTKAATKLTGYMTWNNSK
jgi:hypothetical protein